MKILQYPDPILFRVCKEVIVFDAELKSQLDSMWDTMNYARGMGLAANQVGLDMRMFTMIGPVGERFNIVNPKIVDISKNGYNIPEGCLSAPGQMLRLCRPYWVKIEFQNEKGEHMNKMFSDTYSVCVQHEIEHLDGKSYLQNRAIPKKLRAFLANKWGFKPV